MRIPKSGSVFAILLLTGAVSKAVAAPGQPHIAWMPANHNAGAPIQVHWDMWWGENATQWTLHANNESVCSGTLTANPNKHAQSANCLISPNPGSYDLQVTISNDSGSSISTVKTITVAGNSTAPDPGPGPAPDPDPQPDPDPDPEVTPPAPDPQPTPPDPSAPAPSKPVISWMDSNQKAGDITVTWNMWWGTNGTQWTLTSNGNTICEGPLAVNGNQAQSASCTTSFTGGSYDLQVLLANGTGATPSDIKTISVAGSSGGGGDNGSGGGDNGQGGGGSGNIGSGDMPLETDYSSPDLRKHKPYENTTQSVVGAYFVEWGIYGRKFQPSHIPASNLTHLLYGFIPVCGPNESLRIANPDGYRALLKSCEDKQDFEVTVHDQFAALNKSYPEDQWDQDYKGIFNQLRRIKLANPDMVILPSVGGWTLSDPFYYLDDQQKRITFVNSVVEFLKAYTFFDGVDIDWEYPGGGGANPSLGKTTDGETYVVLMRELREALDDLSADTGRTYQITSAIGAGASKVAAVDYSAASQYMDYIFAMTYDFYGAWNGQLGHHAGLYPGEHAIVKGNSGDEAVDNLLSAGVPASKLVLGVAMYGRGWKGVSNLTSSNPFSGQGGGPITLSSGNGFWEEGVVDYFRIVDEMLGGDANGSGVNGWTAGYDHTAQAPYVWNSTTGELITYENAQSARYKAEYVRQRGLAGTFSWEIDADNGDILNATHEGLGHTPKN